MDKSQSPSRGRTIKIKEGLLKVLLNLVKTSMSSPMVSFCTVSLPFYRDRAFAISGSQRFLPPLRISNELIVKRSILYLPGCRLSNHASLLPETGIAHRENLQSCTIRSTARVRLHCGEREPHCWFERRTDLRCGRSARQMQIGSVVQ